MNNRFIWRRLVLPLLLVLVVSSAIFALLYMRADINHKEALESEVAKAMVHVIAAVLIGNIVLIIIRDFEERRKAWVAKRDLLRIDLTEGLSTLYSRTKGIRRRLRANVRAENHSIDARRYDELLQIINDTQLALERYKRAARSGVRVGLLPESLPIELENMEQYLGKMVSEYEQVLKSEDSGISLTNLPKVMDFIGSYSKSEFRTSFVHSYDRASEAVAKEMEKDLPQVKNNKYIRGHHDIK